tara:strand:+ start:2858 stop:3055 length:198 start_codon:yes stop_codon:yes gene_type:complete
MLGFTIAPAVVGFFIGSYYLGRYSVRRQLRENIEETERFHKKHNLTTDELSLLLQEHKDFLKNKI